MRLIILTFGVAIVTVRLAHGERGIVVLHATTSVAADVAVPVGCTIEQLTPALKADDKSTADGDRPFLAAELDALLSSNVSMSLPCQAAYRNDTLQVAWLLVLDHGYLFSVSGHRGAWNLSPKVVNHERAATGNEADRAQYLSDVVALYEDARDLDSVSVRTQSLKDILPCAKGCQPYQKDWIKSKWRSIYEHINTLANTSESPLVRVNPQDVYDLMIKAYLSGTAPAAAGSGCAIVVLAYESSQWIIACGETKIDLGLMRDVIAIQIPDDCMEDGILPAISFKPASAGVALPNTRVAIMYSEGEPDVSFSGSTDNTCETLKLRSSQFQSYKTILAPKTQWQVQDDYKDSVASATSWDALQHSVYIVITTEFAGRHAVCRNVKIKGKISAYQYRLVTSGKRCHGNLVHEEPADRNPYWACCRGLGETDVVFGLADVKIATPFQLPDN